MQPKRKREEKKLRKCCPSFVGNFALIIIISSLCVAPAEDFRDYNIIICLRNIYRAKYPLRHFFSSSCCAHGELQMRFSTMGRVGKRYCKQQRTIRKHDNTPQWQCCRCHRKNNTAGPSCLVFLLAGIPEKVMGATCRDKNKTWNIISAALTHHL